MILKLFIELFIMSVICVFKVSSLDNNEPMIAFTCHTKRPAVYKQDGQWTKDKKVGCLRDPIEILRFCKKSFPKLPISNVVESNDISEITVWCKNNKKRCLKNTKIRPFRCLVGPFQSDALLVPDKCSFDHEHNSSICANSTIWKIIAEKQCLKREMKLHDYSILLPCAVDAFKGVEFVCCPNGQSGIIGEETSKIKANEKLIDIKIGDFNIKSNKQFSPEINIKSETDTLDKFHKYLNNNYLSNELSNEHEYFLQAMHSMEKQQHEKITKIMQQWSAERQRIPIIRKTQSEDAADKLKAEIARKFQTAYSNLEKQFSEEKAIFLNKHEIRVEKKLDNKKNKAMKLVLDAIKNGNMLNFNDAKRVIKKYIRTEMKDQKHYINRWLHLQSSDEKASKKNLERYLDKISMSNERIKQSCSIVENQLDTEQKSDFKNYVHAFIDEFVDIKEGSEWMLEATSSPTTTTSIPSTTETPTDIKLKNGFNDNDEEDWDDDKDGWDEDKDEWDENWNEDEEDGEIIDKVDYEDEDGNDKMEFYNADDDDDDNDNIHSDISNNDKEYKNGVIEDIENNDIIKNPFSYEKKILPSSAQQSQIEIDKKVAHVAYKSYHNIWVFAVVTLAGAVIIGIIIVAAVIKRKQQLRKKQIAITEVEPFMDVEKRHLTAMQSNGYENPTYKYLETGNN